MYFDMINLFLTTNILKTTDVLSKSNLVFSFYFYETGKFDSKETKENWRVNIFLVVRHLKSPDRNIFFPKKSLTKTNIIGILRNLRILRPIGIQRSGIVEYPKMSRI